MWWLAARVWAATPDGEWQPPSPTKVSAASVIPLAVAPLVVPDGQDLSAHALRAQLIAIAKDLDWPIEGADDEVFGQGGTSARYVLGGTIEGIYDATWHKSAGTGMDIRWELRDQAAESVVYRVTTRGFAPHSGSPGNARLTEAFHSAVSSLFTRELLAAVALRPIAVGFVHMSLCALPEADARSVVVEVARGAARGRGALVSPDGYVWTAAQLVTGARAANEAVWVTLPNGVRLSGDVVAEDSERDIAVVHIPGASFPCRPPVGIAGVGAPVEIGADGVLIPATIQATRTTDGVQLLQINGIAAAARGAPVFDASGSIVGVVTSQSIGEGMSFVVPSPVLLDALNVRIGVDPVPIRSAPLVIDTSDPPIEPLVAEICMFRTSSGETITYSIGRFTLTLGQDEASCLPVPKGTYRVGKQDGGVPVQITVGDNDHAYLRVLKAGLSLSNAHTYDKSVERGDVVLVDGRTPLAN